jgi:hypothetical protein
VAACFPSSQSCSCMTSMGMIGPKPASPSPFPSPPGVARSTGP